MSGEPPPDTWSSRDAGVGAGGGGSGYPPYGQGGHGAPPSGGAYGAPTPGGGYGQQPAYGQPPPGSDAEYEARIARENTSGGGGSGASLGPYPPQQQPYGQAPNQQQYPGPYGGSHQAPQGQQYGAPARHAPSYASQQPPSNYGTAPPMQYVPTPHVPFGPAHPAAGYQAPPNAPAPVYGPAASGPVTGWTPSGRKRALLIGINYKGTPSALAGCVNDVRFIQYLLSSKMGFRPCDTVILTDEVVNVPGARMGKPTRAAILGEMRALVTGVQPGDSLFLHFSGHGKQIPDLSGDEDDGLDEAILPSDYQRSGHIVDDEMYHVLVRALPRGVRLTAIIDACHSATGLDLPYVHGAPGAGPQGSTLIAEGSRGGLTSLLAGSGGGGGNAALASLAMAALGGGKKPMMGGSGGGGGGSLGSLLSGVLMSASGRPMTGKQQARLVEKRQPNPDAGEVIAFSACADHQTAADTHGAVGGYATGACTYSFIQAIEHGGRDWHQYTYESLLVEMRKKMRTKGLKQIPQLTSSFPMSISSRFLV